MRITARERIRIRMAFESGRIDASGWICLSADRSASMARRTCRAEVRGASRPNGRPLGARCRRASESLASVRFGLRLRHKTGAIPRRVVLAACIAEMRRAVISARETIFMGARGPNGSRRACAIVEMIMGAPLCRAGAESAVCESKQTRRPKNGFVASAGDRQAASPEQLFGAIVGSLEVMPRRRRRQRQQRRPRPSPRRVRLANVFSSRGGVLTSDSSHSHSYRLSLSLAVRPSPMQSICAKQTQAIKMTLRAAITAHPARSHSDSVRPSASAFESAHSGIHELAAP